MLAAGIENFRFDYLFFISLPVLVYAQDEFEDVFEPKTTIGGYGELHYNNLDDNELADGDDSFEQTDFHRFVLYFGHQFNDNIRLFSELEVELENANEPAGPLSTACATT